jgi:hypothetical protein
MAYQRAKEEDDMDYLFDIAHYSEEQRQDMISCSV